MSNGEKYLNENSIFKCSHVPIVTFKAMCTNNVKIKDKSILNTSTKLFIKEPKNCPLNTAPNGVPLPCSCIMVVGSWEKVSKNVSHGNKLLTERSTIKPMNCQFGSILSVDNSSISNISVDNSKVTYIKPVFPTNIDMNKDNPKIHDNFSNNNPKIHDDFSNDNPKIHDDFSNNNPKIHDNFSNDNPNILKNENNHDNLTSVEKPINRVCKEEIITKKWCSGKCPSQYSECCPFCEVSSIELNEKNNSNTLKNNMMKNQYDDYTKQYNNIINNQPYTCKLSDNTEIDIPIGIAHHHMISGGKDCFENAQKNEYLIKLANFYGQDSINENYRFSINDANNGICLPSYVKDSDYSILNDLEKINFKYFAMKMTNCQIHIGEHGFQNKQNLLENSHNECIDNFNIQLLKWLKSIKKVKYECYYDLVLNMLSNVERELIKYNSNTCRMQSIDKDAKNFYEKLYGFNGVSKKIANKIKNFDRFFVSVEALAYKNNIEPKDLQSILK